MCPSYHSTARGGLQTFLLMKRAAKKPAAGDAGGGPGKTVSAVYLKNTVVLATVMTVIRMPLRKAGSQMLPVRL